MTERSDILPSTFRGKQGWRRLSYTRRCGWVDWGHAIPDGPAGLRDQLRFEGGGMSVPPGLRRIAITLQGQPAFIVAYGQEMVGPGIPLIGGRITVSTVAHYVVRRRLTAQARERVGLGIFMHASKVFESLQASPPFAWRGSGFSIEDLPSNLIGFYSAFRGLDQSALRDVCGETDVKESLRIWDAHTPDGLGAVQNHTFVPVLFPTQAKGDVAFPPLLTEIRPAPPGSDWVAVRGRFIDGRLANAGAPIDVSSTGMVRAVPPRRQHGATGSW